MENLIQELQAVLGEEGLKLQEPMKEHTTFRVGGPADVCFFPKTADEVRRLRTVCVCRIETEAILDIAREEKRSRTRPTYDWSLGAKGAYLLTLTDGEQTVTARFAPDRTMAAMIAYGISNVNF